MNFLSVFIVNLKCKINRYINGNIKKISENSENTAKTLELSLRIAQKSTFICHLSGK